MPKVRGNPNPVQLDKSVPRSKCRLWELRVSVGKDLASGAYRPVTRRFHGTLADANAALRDLIAEIEHRDVKRRSDMLFSEYADAWCAERVGKVAAGTLSKEKGHIKAAKLHIGQARLDERMSKVLESMYSRLCEGESLSGCPLSASYVNGIAVTLHRLFWQAVRDGHLPSFWSSGILTGNQTMLGWEELADEHIEFCEDMTEDEVKAFRLADNRTGQTGKWNKALIREEVRRLAKRGVDMSRLGFDFKSRLKPYGAERLKTDEHYNLGLVNAAHTRGDWDMPKIAPVDFEPSRLLPFNYAKIAKERDCTLHFFVGDYQFERPWNRSEHYLPLISGFEAVLTPDFSLYMDMPLPMQQ